MLKHFNYWLTGSGWAEVFFTSDEQSIRFEFSYLSDPLTDLLDLLLTLLEDVNHQGYVDFFDEPGIYRLSFIRTDDRNLKIEIRSSAEVEGISDIKEDWSSNKPIFKTIDTINNLCSVIYAGIVDLKGRHNEDEYLREWLNYPFPGEQFKLFEDAVKKRSDRNS